jgi:hypothetical protein
MRSVQLYMPILKLALMLSTRARPAAGATYLSVIPAGLQQVNVFRVNLSPTASATHILAEETSTIIASLYFTDRQR